jgi:hypothetical protein
MLYYSASTFNDINGYGACQDQFGDVADYTLMNLNITHLPLAFRFGLCLPK